MLSSPLRSSDSSSWPPWWCTLRCLPSVLSFGIWFTLCTSVCGFKTKFDLLVSLPNPRRFHHSLKFSPTLLLLLDKPLYSFTLHFLLARYDTFSSQAQNWSPRCKMDCLSKLGKSYLTLYRCCEIKSDSVYVGVEAYSPSQLGRYGSWIRCIQSFQQRILPVLDSSVTLYVLQLYIK